MHRSGNNLSDTLYLSFDNDTILASSLTWHTFYVLEKLVLSTQARVGGVVAHAGLSDTLLIVGTGVSIAML